MFSKANPVTPSYKAAHHNHQPQPETKSRDEAQEDFLFISLMKEHLKKRGVKGV